MQPLVCLHFAENGTVTSAHPEPVSWTSGLSNISPFTSSTKSTLRQLAILFSLKTMELLQTGVATHFR